MYGIEHAAEDYGFQQRAAMYTRDISMRYVDYILDRTDMYYVDQLGIQDSLGFDGYLFSGMVVLLFSVSAETSSATLLPNSFLICSAVIPASSTTS